MLFVEEAAMTVPVVADLDRVILRRGIEESSWDVVTAEAGDSASFCD